MRAEIVSVGDELLKGQRVNTNAAFISSALAGIGVPVGRVVACSDLEDEIIAAFAESLERHFHHAPIVPGARIPASPGGFRNLRIVPDLTTGRAGVQ